MVLRCSAGSTAPCTSYNRRRGQRSWAGPPRPPRCPTWVDLERGSLLRNGQSVRPGSCKSQRDYRTHPGKITHQDIKGRKVAKKRGRNKNKQLLFTQVHQLRPQRYSKQAHGQLVRPRQTKGTNKQSTVLPCCAPLGTSRSGHSSFKPCGLDCTEIVAAGKAKAVPLDSRMAFIGLRGGAAQTAASGGKRD